MNKLIVDNILDLSDIVITEDTEVIINLENVSDTVHIHIDDNVCLYELSILKNTKNKIFYHLGENSNVVINKIAVDNSDDVSFYLDGENASLTCNSSIINYSNNTYSESIYHNKHYTMSNLSNHAINMKDNDFTFKINASIPINSDNSYSKQDNRIINMGSGKNEILPNLLVDNHIIEASHSAYIGQFNKDSIFYLMTRGISYGKIIELLSKGFLLEEMELKEEREKVEAFIKTNM